MWYKLCLAAHAHLAIVWVVRFLYLFLYFCYALFVVFSCFMVLMENRIFLLRANGNTVKRTHFVRVKKNGLFIIGRIKTEYVLLL